MQRMRRKWRRSWRRIQRRQKRSTSTRWPKCRRALARRPALRRRRTGLSKNTGRPLYENGCSLMHPKNTSFYLFLEKRMSISANAGGGGGAGCGGKSDPWAGGCRAGGVSLAGQCKAAFDTWHGLFVSNIRCQAVSIHQKTSHLIICYDSKQSRPITIDIDIRMHVQSVCT